MLKLSKFLGAATVPDLRPHEADMIPEEAAVVVVVVAEGVRGAAALVGVVAAEVQVEVVEAEVGMGATEAEVGAAAEMGVAVAEVVGTGATEAEAVGVVEAGMEATEAEVVGVAVVETEAVAVVVVAEVAETEAVAVVAEVVVRPGAAGEANVAAEGRRLAATCGCRLKTMFPPWEVWLWTLLAQGLVLCVDFLCLCQSTFLCH